MKYGTNCALSVCVTAAAMAAATSATAQQSLEAKGSSSVAQASVAEIVVTAEKRNSTVQKTPLSITAVTGADLQSRGLSSAQGIVQAVPGIAVTSAGPEQAQYEIRGLSADGGESPTIGFYLDEIPITPPATATTGKSAIDPDLYDLNRVEVLRGPQGTLYGAGSMGGTVKLVTNVPDFSGFYGTEETTLAGTSGGGLDYGAKAALNIPLLEDKVALRVVGTYDHESGWIDRVVVPNFPLETNGGLTRGDVLASPPSVVHRGVNDEDLGGVRVALLIKPSDRLSITPSVFYQNINQGGMNTFDSVPGTLAHYQPFDIAEPSTDSFTVWSLTGAYDFGSVKLTSATGYWTRRSTQIQDNTELTQDALGLPSYDVASGGAGPVQAYEIDETNQFSQELRLSSNGSGRFQWLLGAFFSDYRDTVRAGSIVPGLVTAAGGAFGTSNLFTNIVPLHIKEEAGFFHLDYQLLSDLKLEVGGRYYAYTSRIDSWVSGALFNSATPVLNTGSASANDFSPMFNISWAPNHNLMFYANAAKGFREGAGNFPVPTTGTLGSVCLINLEAIGRTSAPLSFNPDTVWSYEVGEKGCFFGGRLTVNADVFDIEWSKVQEPVALPCGLPFTTNGPDANVKGGELELEGHIGHGLTISQSVGYADAAFTNSFLPAGVVKGESLLDAPRWTLSTNVSYRHSVGAYTFVIQGQNSFQSVTYDISYQLNRIPSRDFTNVRVSLKAKRWSVYLFVNNIFNVHAQLENLSLTPFTGPTYNRVATNQPLTAGVELGAKF